jgi:S-adenosylmethionine hydrolase
VIEKISKTYAEVKSGQLVALINSSGLLEIGVRNGNARDLTKAGYGERIFLKVKKI